MDRSRASQNDDEANPPHGDGQDSSLAYRVAIHEAGHAVAMVVLGFDILSADIRPCRTIGAQSGRGSTAMRVYNAKDIIGGGEAVAMPYLISLLAGPIAESVVRGDMADMEGSSDDALKARVVAQLAVAEKAGKKPPGEADQSKLDRDQKRMEAMIEAAGEQAARLVGYHWLAVEAVAAFLGVRQELSGDEIAAIVASFPPMSDVPWQDIELSEA
jgi:hypothetical protein